MQERSFSVQWVVSISLVDRKYKHIWSYIIQGDFLLNKNAKYFLEGFTAPFCSLISHLLAFINQKAPWCPKRTQHTWKKARLPVLISSSAMFLITYFQLQSSIFTIKVEKGLSLLSYVHSILLNIIIILIKSNCQNMAPQFLPDWLPGRWLANLEILCEQKTWYSSAPEWNYSCVVAMVDMFQSRTKEPETS